MFAIDRNKKDTCSRCGDAFAAPSYTKDGMPMYGLCQRCNDQDDEDSRMFSDPRKELEMCGRCMGTGEITDCVDDLCQSDAGCIHGDSEVTCPDCGGKGEF